MLSAVFLAFFGAIVTRTDDSVDWTKDALRRRDVMSRWTICMSKVIQYAF